MNELQICEAWLYDSLSPFGSVYNGAVPFEASFPCIVFACQGGTDLNSVNQHIWAELDYVIKVWGTAYEDTIFNNVCGALERKIGVSLTAGYIQSSIRTNTRSTQETENGIIYYSREATFRIRVIGE